MTEWPKKQQSEIWSKVMQYYINQGLKKIKSYKK